MRVVGITGGIGSGKSTLAAAFAGVGVPVVDADAVARRCVEPGTPALDAIVNRFGAAMLRPDGTLDRAALAAVVFADDAARHDLEAITHPCIRAGIDAELGALRSQVEAPAVAVVEHPLLVETGLHREVDVVVVVEASLERRVRRLVDDRGMTESDVRGRIRAQADDATRRAVADVVVHNDDDLARLRDEAMRILDRLRREGDPRSEGGPESGR